MADKTYDRSILEADPAFTPPEPPPGLAEKVAAAGWPDGLFDRVRALRRNWGEIEAWVDNGFPTVEMIEVWVPQEEALLDSTLTVRQGGWDDNDLIDDLCRHSPERAGDWDVIVERGPHAFAQFRLQERAFVVLVEDRRVGLGMVSRSLRNTYVEGERTSVHFISGWRVRDGFRGLGISRLLLEGAGPGHGFFGVVFYWYVRLENDDRAWVDKVTTDMADRPEGWVVTTDKLTATVTHLREPGEGRSSERVRPATEADLGRCCELINRTHAGLDLFRPYTEDFLATRLDDPNWGPRPEFIAEVYGWGDLLVVEADGGAGPEIVACAGLWDRGRDLRERWRHRETGEEDIIESTALMDFGHAEGHEAALAELIEHHLHRTAELGRRTMIAPLEFLPSVTEAIGHLTTGPETRELQTMPFVAPGVTIETTITRPYTDLAYW